ncbi:hypothetical protein MRB53_042365 [Persea americana]|nr:hypothetical protein MRB53_042365 [Persea americana]
MGQYRISPFVHTLSNHFSTADALRKIPVPDVVPSETPLRDFSMAAGEFVECFGNEESASSFDAVVTCFFLDTAHNVIDYIQTIRNTLVDGGYWINVGPLLWHHEHGSNRHGKTAFDEQGEFIGSIELSMDETFELIEKLGFTIEHKTTIKTGYMNDERSMSQHIYDAQLFTARLKKLRDVAKE